MWFNRKDRYEAKAVQEIRERKAKKHSRDYRFKSYLAISMAAILTFTSVYALILNAITLEDSTAASMPGMVLEGEEGGETVETRELSAEDGDISAESSDAETENIDNQPVVMGGDLVVPEETSAEEIAASNEETNAEEAASAEGFETTEAGQEAENPDEVEASGSDDASAGETSVAAEEVSDEADSVGETEGAEDAETSDPAPSEDAETSADPSPENAETEGENSETTEETQEPQLVCIDENQPLVYEGEDYRITLTASEDAKIPADAALSVAEIAQDTDEYVAYLANARAALGLSDDEALPSYAARFFDITIMSQGNEIEPQASVKVEIALVDKKIKQDEDVQIVHEVEEGVLETPEVTTDVVKAEDLQDSEIAVEAEAGEDVGVSAKFEAGSFSVYGVVYSVITTEYITASGETYTITVEYDEEAGIPEGAELRVREILNGTDEFNSYFSAAIERLFAENKIITFARFFDIEIVDSEGRKIEPITAVRVKIQLSDALVIENDSDLQVIHFTDKDTEIISDVMMNESATEINYQQNSFSVTGTIVSPPTSSEQGDLGKYALVVHYNDQYYVVENDGTLTLIQEGDIEFGDNGEVTAVKMINPISWTYSFIGYSNYTLWHDTDANSFDAGTSLPNSYDRRYLSADVADGYVDLDDDTNPWTLQGQFINVGYNNESHSINHYGNFIGITEDTNGILRICGQSEEANAAEIYFAEAQGVRDVSVWNHTVNHIDISVDGSAGIKVPLAFGTYKLAKVSDEDLKNLDNIEDITTRITGYRDEDLIVTATNNVTLETERTVPITQEDIRKADITAYTEWTGQRVYLDDVYMVTGYSGNAEAGESTAQVRLEGSFKVSDLGEIPTWYASNENEANNLNYFENGQDTGKQIKDVRLERPIYYTVGVTKSVTFTMTYEDSDGQTYVVLKDDGTPFKVTVSTTLSSSFSYWDTDNECPGIDLWTYGRNPWRDGEIRSNNNALSGLDAGPGMDFKLGAPIDEAGHDIVAIEVTKYVQGDFGSEVRTLSLESGTVCDVSVYQNNNTTALHDKVLSVGRDGIGMINDYDIVGGTYENMAYAQISENPDSVADEVYDSSGNKWVYDHSRVETEFAWRNNGNNNPSRYVSEDYIKEDGPYYSASEVVGEYYVEGGIPYDYKGVHYDGVHEYNRFLEFYIYNIYVRAGFLRIDKSVTYNGKTPIPDDKKSFLAGDYVFKIYRDEACLEPYRVRQGENQEWADLTFTVTILDDGTARSSEVVELPVGDYWIEEQVPQQEGVAPTENRKKVTVTVDNTSTAPAVVSFVNNHDEVPVDIDVLKVERENETIRLSDAVFELRQIIDEEPVSNALLQYVKDDNKNDIVITRTTDADGRLTFENLTYGYYEIREVTPPPGYVLSTDVVFYLKVDDGDVKYLQKGSGKPSTWSVQESAQGATVVFTPAQNELNAIFTVSNTPGAELPETGGRGPILYITLGILLLASTGVLLLMQRKDQI